MSPSSEIKKELYNRVRQEVDEKMGNQGPEIKNLEKTMTRFQKRSWKSVTTSSFEKAIFKTPLVFWGDFHGVRQYQRSLLRWLEMRPDVPHTPFCLALECLPHDKQHLIDQYLNHAISEKEFLDLVDWQKSWGFPWEHYKPLFDHAKQKGFPILALNTTRPGSSLKSREKKAMQLIQALQKKSPGLQIWVLYGEYHLLPNHFPSLFKKQKDQCLFVLQNADDLYFQKPPKKEKEVSLLKYGSNFFCQQSVAPWIKWQSYLLFLETLEDAEFEEGFDISEHIIKLSGSLSQELRWDFQSDAVSALTIDDPQLWKKMKLCSANERRILEKMVQEGFSIVSNQRSWSFLGRMTVNEMGSLAFMNLWFQNCPGLTWPDRNRWRHQEWQHLIWIMSFCYFGSKILNPHRKTPLLSDLQNLAKSGYQPFERQAARVVINYWLQRNLNRFENIFETTPSDRVQFLAVSWIAGLIGEQIYSAFENKRLNLDSLKAYLKKDPSQTHFSVVIQSLDEILSSPEAKI
jgi:hypothetical protein